MAIYAIKKGEETNDRLQQRFKKQVQKTNLIKVLRDRKRHKKKDPKKNRRLGRLRALKRESYREANKKKQFYSNM